MRSDVAICAEHLTKTFRIFGHPGDRIKQALTLGRMRFHDEFTALRNVSFEVRKGESVGIIGRNGSGKSTLLQLICGILKPTSGSVRVDGRISALLELGAGFNPEFTGRENVYFQGALLGLDRQDVARRFESIAAFADIGDFIDQPVRTYSSGMFVRLAFAVAASVEPAILVVDEALSVGDIGFQQKCLERIREMREAGVTIFLVSHDMMLMRTFGDKLIYLEQGQIKAIGDPETVGEAYIRDAADDARGRGDSAALSRGGSALNRIREVSVAKASDTVRVHVAASVCPDVTCPEIVIQLRDPRGYILYGRHALDGDISMQPLGTDAVQAEVTLELDVEPLAGNYGISVSLNRVAPDGTVTVLDKQIGVASLQVLVPKDAGFHGSVNLGGRWLREVPSDRALKGIAP